MRSLSETTLAVNELTDASKRRESASLGGCYGFARASGFVDARRITGGNSTRGCTNTRVAARLQGARAIIRRRSTRAFIFHREAGQRGRKEAGCDASFHGAAIEVAYARERGLIIEL